jgi:hypothetical protein
VSVVSVDGIIDDLRRRWFGPSLLVGGVVTLSLVGAILRWRSVRRVTGGANRVERLRLGGAIG